MNEINKINDLNEDIKKNQPSILKVLFFVICSSLIISLSFIFYGSDKYINNLENQIQVKDSLIQSLTEKDSIYNKVFSIKCNSDGTKYSYTIRERNGKIVRYDELLNENDSITGKLNDLETKSIKKQSILESDRDALLKDRKSLVKNYAEVITDYNKLVEKSNNQIKLIDKYRKDFFLKSDSLSTYKIVYSLIQRNYNIQFKIKNEGSTERISIYAEHLDSAIVLFPYYKHKITNYSQKDGVINSTVIIDEKQNKKKKMK